MSKRQKQKQELSRFEVGSRGGCEACLFEFREQISNHNTETEPSEAVRIAARSFDEALAYLRWRETNLVIGSVQNLGLILIVSGSPVD